MKTECWHSSISICAAVVRLGMRMTSSIFARGLSSMPFKLALGLGLSGALISPGASWTLNQAEKPIWIGQTGNFMIHWTSANMTIAPSGDRKNILFSVQELARKNFQVFKKESIGDWPNPECEYEQRFRLLSVVGPIVSYELLEYSYCKDADGSGGWAHPSVGVRYSVIDLNHPGERVTLTSLFPEASILKALLTDPLVKRALTDRGPPTPRTLSDFARLVKDSTPLELEPTAGTKQAPRECSFLFPDDFLSQFAFHHLEDGMVAVRLSLEPSSGACRTAHTELGLLLPIPQSLKSELAQGAVLRQGFLLKDHLKMFGSQDTLIKYEVKPSKRD